jgi:imidazolonepropionase-like amidohydrolase
VEPGKLADLVLLTANPLADIRNSSRTAYVIANGHVHVIRRDTLGRLIRD